MQSNLRSLVGTEFGDYRLTAILGEGGMAVVFRGESVVHRSIVRAIKVIRPEFAAVPEFATRFGDEAGMLFKLRHPNIVDFHGVRRAAHAHGTLLAMELELLEGHSLDTLLKQSAGRAFPVRQAIEIMLQASRGVAHAHSLGVVHRDLKPGNVFVLADGRTKVVDFGIAKAFDDADRTTGMTRTGTVPGTPAYMAPEVCNGALPDAAADVYALGLTLLEMLLGHHPYNPPGQNPKSSTQMMMAQVAHALPVVTSRRQDIPSKIAEAVERATHKQVALRYRDAGELAAALERALADLGGAPAGAAPSASMEEAPLSTSMAIPTLGASPASAPPANPANVHTEFAVPTMQRAATTEPLALRLADTAKGSKLAPYKIVLGAGVSAVVLLIVAVAMRGGPTPSRPDAGAVGDGGQAIAAEASVATETPAAQPRVLNRWVTIHVPSSALRLGVSQDNLPETVTGFRPRRSIESPAADYAIQQHEVTWEEFAPWQAHNPAAVVNAPATLPADPAQRARLPVTGAAWETAHQYCRSLGGALPTEEQWEFAARGEQLRPQPWGTEGIDLVRTYVYQGPQATVAEVMSHEQDATPGSDETILYDMLGNAQEWTTNLYRLDAPAPAPAEAWVQAGGVTFRSVRGLPLAEAPPAVLPSQGAAARGALCATGPCPPVGDGLRTVGFRCARVAR